MTRSLLRTAGLTLIAALTLSAQNGPNRLLVKFTSATASDQARAVLANLGVRVAAEIPALGVHVVELPANASDTAYMNRLRSLPNVEYVEPDALRKVEQVTNDPLYSSEWHLSRINTSAAWGVSTGSGVTVAICDTGVDPTHEDLIGKLVPGWNVVDNNTDTRDVYGHGTNVAGTVAATTNNGLGVSSIARDSLIMPIRVSLTNGSAYDSAIASGITWAADHGARVANVSYQVTGSATVSSAGKYMQGKGGVVTVSAGNYSTFDAIPNDPYLITVGATDPYDALYSWSDTGTDVDVVAPGCVTTTMNGGGYGGTCGTSFSAPVTAAVAALIIAAKPSLSAAQITNIIQTSADDLGATGYDTTFGFGRVNAYRAVTSAGTTGGTSGGTSTDTQPPTVYFSTPSSGAILAGSISVSVVASDNVGIASVDLTANGKAIGSLSSAPFTFAWNTTGGANGTYTLSTTARDTSGNVTSATVSVSVNNASDVNPPVVTITSPVASALLSGPTTLSVSATDNVGVVRVEYYLDGKSIAASTNAPFNVRWNPNKVASGAHSLQAKAYDAKGNFGWSTPVSITVR